jgi:CheY-like chemotaxis protein
MGGVLDVESTEGVGSTFWVELPRAASPLAAKALDTSGAASRYRRQRGGHRGRKILYIEDNLSNLHLVERILDDEHLLSAMQGQLGLELAREHRPDLVLLDLQLPDIPGDLVLSRLREQPETAGVPVVILSADATPGQVRRLLEGGATAYLTKPLDVSEFLRTVDEALSRSRYCG